jgi:hypothetical protein
MAGRVVAVQFRRIEPRGYASIEKKSIVAAQAITKETGKLVEVHPPLGYDEVSFGRLKTQRTPHASQQALREPSPSQPVG